MLFVGHRMFASTVGPAVFFRWSILYVLAVMIGILIPNFWLVMLGLFVVCVTIARRADFAPSAFLILLMALPSISRKVSGVGGLENLMTVSPTVIYVLALFVPLVFTLLLRKPQARAGGGADWFFAGFLWLSIIFCFRDTTFTNGLREILFILMTVAAPYYVISRSPKSAYDLRLMVAALVLGAMLQAAIAVQGSFVNWSIFSLLPSTWESTTIVRYSHRADILRATGATLNPLALAAILASCLLLILPLIEEKKRTMWFYIASAVIFAGLLATVARGSWFSLVIGAGIYLVTSPNAFSMAMRYSVFGLVGMVMIAVSPIGAEFAELIPFLNDDVDSTLDYRQRLFEVAMPLVDRSPLFGYADPLALPEMQQMVQGQGIIDLVNHYVAIALYKGYVGLFLFVGFHAGAAFALWRNAQALQRIDVAQARIHRGVLAAHVCLASVIATTSPVAQLELFMWVMPALSVGAARVAALQAQAALQTAPETAPDASPDASPDGRPTRRRLTAVP